ncbi:hypothetical protein SteCoe_20271 [Stentor coeruleus]|uniref:Uncharacterized protein n=1 Tax=Stentor coeruleus TaxID=5963 RepID=A0A1R2BSH5_9CILI|nr:hypothetical protein SteCoe_20271 [Stentor coeruleus]
MQSISTGSIHNSPVPKLISISKSHMNFKEQFNLKEKLLQDRNNTPEGFLKLKSTMIMYESIKKHLTPAKIHPRMHYSSLRSLSKTKLNPVAREELTKLNLKDRGLGDDYAKALSQTVRDLPNLKELNIRNNRIADEGLNILLISLKKKNMKTLDLSNNIISTNSIKTLSNMLNSFESCIEKLSLESINLTLKGLKIIITALRSNHSLQELNIANNKLGPGCGNMIKELVLQTTTLKKLDLHWNLFKGQEGVLVFEGLGHNDTLKAVDLSWNSIGSEICTIEALCWFLTSESMIEHLDISHNRISFDSGIALGNALKNNRTIIGLHVEGNYCTIDHLGFVFPLKEICISPTLQKSARILRTPRRINDHKCWICNKYVDFDIKWDPDLIHWRRKLFEVYTRKHKVQREYVYIHLELDDYNPFLLEPSQGFLNETIRAVPRATPIKFFFSYRGKAQVSSQYPKETLEHPIEKTIKYGENQSISLVTHTINYIILDSHILTCKPRPEIKTFILEIPDAPITAEWQLGNSIFANYYCETEELLNRCFEFDWKNTKMLRVIKNDTLRDRIKELVRPYYKFIRKTYRLYAAIGTNGSIFSINLAILTELCQKCEIFDKNFKISDVDLALKASKYSKNTTNSAYGLVRHEFLEFLIRVSLDKYYRSGLCFTECEAIETFFQTHFINHLTIYEQDKWRVDRLFNKECEEVLIENREIFQTIFDIYSGRKAKPGEKKYMLVEDFLNLCQNHGLMSETFNIRHATLCFHMALMTHVDEISGIIHTEATKIEFVDALARVVEHFNSPDPEKDMLGYIYTPPMLSKKLSEAVEQGFVKYRLFKKSTTRSSFA